MLLHASILISLTLGFHHSSAIEQELELDRIQEAQMRRQEEERRREQAMREARMEEELERRRLEERSRESIKEEQRAQELKFQRDMDRRKREELRAQDDQWARDQEEGRRHHPGLPQQPRQHMVATDNVMDEGWQPVPPQRAGSMGGRPAPAPNRLQQISPPQRPEVPAPRPAAKPAADPVFEI